MSGLNALIFALALVLWMKARTTNSSTSVTTPQASGIVTSSYSTSASFVVQASENVTSSPVHVIPASGTVNASENVTSSSIHVTLANVTVQASKNVTSSTVYVTSESITLKASENVTSSPVASVSLTLHAPKNVTSSALHVTSASVTVQAPKNVTSSASTFATVQASMSVTIIVKGSASSQPPPGISSFVHFNKTSQPSTQVSANASSSVTASSNATTSLSSSAAVSASTSVTSQTVSTFSAPGQTLKMSMLQSSGVPMPSPSVSQSTQVGISTLAQSKETTASVMSHLVGSLTVSSTSNFSSTSSPPVNSTSPSLPATPTTAQPTAPTLPPGGTKFVSMEVSFNIAFKEEYSDTGSPEYKELKDNLTTSLEIVYKNVDGFVGVQILFITKGSVVCSYIVILAKDSKVKPEELKEKLQKASDAGELFEVKSIKVEEDDSEETEEKLPHWALVVMIVLGCLSAVFLVTVIYLCVKYRRSLYGSSEAYLVSTGEIGLAHAYDRVLIGDNKKEANQGTAQKPAADRRVIGSHTNPTYGSNGALAD